jgi:hypothetical protein
MSYPGQAPVAPGAPHRPVTVRAAVSLLLVMAVAGLGYAVTTLAVVPGVVDRFRAGVTGPDSTDVDGYVTVVWIGAAFGAIVAVILVALFVVLALGLRRGSSASRVGTWVVCGLGVLFGCGTLATVGAQRAGEGTPGTLGYALSEAYPNGWIGWNVGLAIAQMAGYLAVAVLLIAAPGSFFGRGRQPVHPSGSGAYVTLPTYGSINPYPQPPYGQDTGTSQPLPAPPRPGPDDEYWSRPSS